MAQRDLTNFRTVRQNVIENKGQLLNAGMNMAENILRQGEEAKLSEGLSVAQLELAELDNKFKLDFQGDPTNKDGISKYKADRKKIYDTLGGNVSMLYRNQWQAGTRKITERNDAMMQSWGLKQTQVNTVKSVNSSMKNGLTQAANDGMALGSGDITIEQALINFANTRENLSTYAERNLGETTGGEAVKNYGEDHMKVLISGVSETNPIEAARMLDNEAVKNSFSDPAQWKKMKDAVDNRVLNFQKIAIQREAIGARKNSAGILNRSMEKPFTQAEIMDLSQNVSEPTKNYLMKLGGFKKSSDKISQSDKMIESNALTEEVLLLSGKENIDGKDIAKVHDNIMRAVDNKSITRKKALFLTNDFMIPYADQLEENMSQFEIKKNNWFTDDVNVGFSQLQDYTNQFLVGEGGIDIEDLTEEEINFNNKQKMKIYGNYSDALKSEARIRNVSVASLMQLEPEERNRALNLAARRAKTSYLTDMFPELGSMKDNMPAKIIPSDGSEIRTGLGNGKPVASVSTSITSDDINKMTIEELNAFLGK